MPVDVKLYLKPNSSGEEIHYDKVYTDTSEQTHTKKQRGLRSVSEFF